MTESIAVTKFKITIFVIFILEKSHDKTFIDFWTNPCSICYSNLIKTKTSICGNFRLTRNVATEGFEIFLCLISGNQYF